MKSQEVRISRFDDPEFTSMNWPTGKADQMYEPSLISTFIWYGHTSIWQEKSGKENQQNSQDPFMLTFKKEEMESKGRTINIQN